MKKMITALLISTLICVIGCGKSEAVTDTNALQSSNAQASDTAQKNEGISKIVQLKVYSAIQNETHIYHVDYPYQYYYAVADKDGNGGTAMHYMQKNVNPQSVSSEETQYFYNYILNLPKEYGEKNEAASYEIHFFYKTEDGKSTYLTRIGYGSFPAQWEIFIEHVNTLTGENLLAEEGELQTVTPEFLEEAFGVTAKDLQAGTIKNMIETQGLTMINLSNRMVMSDILKNYYVHTQEDQLLLFKPNELRNVPSTAEEYDAFLCDYLSKIGFTMQMEEETKQTAFRYFYNPETNQNIYTAQSCDLENLPICEDRLENGYRMVFDTHMEGMVYEVNFYYSSNGKFILVPDMDDPDVVPPFCE